MEISHVMRGEEWLSTAPLHILLYEALNWETPIFAHLPVVKGSDGKKLSKRHGATLASAFRDDGYLPQAVLNYVSLVGWSPGEGDNQEVFTREELIQKFSLEHISEASAVFDYSKLQWMNGVYIRNLSVDEFLKWVTPFLTAEDVHIPEPTLRKLAPLIQERIRTFKEAPAMLEFLTTKEIAREWDGVFKKNMTKELCISILNASLETIKTVSEFNEVSLEESLKKVAETLGIKAGQLLSTVRIAALAKAATPPLYESLVCLGRDVVVQKINDALKEVEAR
jgi:glutamyl-tRNA synthetase